MATKTLLTLADYAALPADGKRYELVEGELVELTFPNLEHSRIQAFLVTELNLYLRKNPIGRAGSELGFILGREPDTLRGPDVYFVSQERLQAAGGRGWIEGAPDLAVEILSPSNSQGDIDRKLTQYFEAGSKLVWVIEPKSRSVRVVAVAGERLLGEGDSLTAPDLLPGFSVSIREALDT